MWSRVFGARNLLPVPVVGQQPYDQEFADAALEFLDTQRYPWPSRAASDLLKLRLQPYLDAPCFEYERESDMLAARGHMLKLWALALSRLTGTAGRPASAQSHRALSNMVIAIAQRNEFHLEYLGFRLPSKKRGAKTRRRGSAGEGPSANAVEKALDAAPASGRSTAVNRARTTNGAVAAFSFARNKVEAGSQSNSKGRRLPPHQNGKAQYYYKEASLPLPRMGAFDPKLRKQLDQGHEYCQLLGLTVVYMTGRIEDVEAAATATNVARRKSMSGSLDSPIRKSSSAQLYHHHELRFFATVIVLAYFRAPQLIVPLIVQGARRALEDMAPGLLRMRMSADSVEGTPQSNAGAGLFRSLSTASNGPNNSEDAASVGAEEARHGGSSVALGEDRGGDSGGNDGSSKADAGRTLSTSSVSSNRTSEDERWGAVCRALHDVQMSAMHSPGAQYRHTLFVANNPTLFSWRAFYTELSPALHEGLQKPSQWLKKLLTNGYFYALFMSEFVKHVGNIVATAPANSDSEADTIAWEIIPGYFLLIKLFTCLQRQFFIEKLQSFENTATLKRYGRLSSLPSQASNPSTPSRSVSSSTITPADAMVLRFRAETPKSFNAITQAAKDLLDNPNLLRVWANVCIGYTNIFQSRSVEISMNHLNGWTKVVGNPSVCTRVMDMKLLVRAIEILIESDHHRILTSVLSFLYTNIKRLFVASPQTRHHGYLLKLIGVILLSRNFFNLFLHWDHAVRVHFHHILVYRLFEGSRARLELEMDTEILYYLSSAEAQAELEAQNSQKQYDPSLAIKEANSRWRTSRPQSNVTSSATTAATTAEEGGLEKPMQRSVHEAGDVIDTLDIHTFLHTDSNADSTPTERMREARQLVMGSLPQEVQQREEVKSENDLVLVEIYGTMMRRVMNLLSEGTGASAANNKAAEMRKRREVTCDMDETAADTGGLPRGRAVYVRKSLCEFGGLLKQYYTRVARSDTGCVPGPATIIMNV